MELSISVGIDEAFAELLSIPLDRETPHTHRLQIIDELNRYLAANEKRLIGFRPGAHHVADTAACHRGCQHVGVERDRAAPAAPARRLTGPPVSVRTAPVAVSRVLELQRRAGNRATTLALSEPGDAGLDLRSGLAVQRDTGFEVEAKSVRYRQDADVIVFDRAKTSLDAAELAKIAFIAPELNASGQPVGLRASASEDEDDLAAVATARRDAVRDALIAGGLKVNISDVPHPLAEAKGNFDYREQRKVQILTGPALAAAMAAPPPVGDGRVHGTDKDYARYGVADALIRAEQMVDQAAAMVAALPEGPALNNERLRLFRRYFTTAKPSVVAERLRSTRAQIAHYRPEAPKDVLAAGGGHACYDETRPGVLFVNEGHGAEARMIIGADAKSLTAAGRAYNVVHEATHGAPELQTRDHAYVWQATFHYLAPEQQLNNADSYGVLVALLTGLSQAPPGAEPAEAAKHDVPGEAVATASTAGLPAPMDPVLKKTWAWLEFYMTQVWLNLRDLYPAMAAGSPLPKGSYPLKLSVLAGQHLGIKRHEFTKVAGVLDRIDDMKSTTTFKKAVFTTQLTAQPDGTVNIVVPPTLGTHERAVMQWQLTNIIASTPSIVPALRAPYADFITATAVMSNWGGPLT